MRICIPIESNTGIQSKVFDRFVSAAHFLIFDTDKERYDVIDNSGGLQREEISHPFKVLENKSINAVICRGMDARTVQKLNEMGIRVYRTDAKTVLEIIENCKKGKLEEITVDNASTGHNCN